MEYKLKTKDRDTSSLPKIIEQFIELIETTSTQLFDIDDDQDHSVSQGVENIEFMEKITQYQKALSKLLGVYQGIDFSTAKESFLSSTEKTVSLAIEAGLKLQQKQKQIQGESHIVELDEYQLFKEFYQKKIFPISEELSDWRALIHQIEKNWAELKDTSQSNDRNYIEQNLLSIENVKKDHYYELFHLRKEDGKPFFHKKLIQNIRLLCQLGEFDINLEGDDPLVHSQIWREKTLQKNAQAILQTVYGEVNDFLKEVHRYKDMELTKLVKKVMMALMLSANSRNLIGHAPVKTCIQYFGDFQHFLQHLIRSQEYQKLLNNPPPKTNQFLWDIITFVQGVCFGVYSLNPTPEVFKNLMEEWVGEVDENVDASDVSKIVDLIVKDEEIINKKLGHVPCGPLFKALDLVIEERASKGFSNSKLNHFSYKSFCVTGEGQNTALLHLPSPTEQVYVHKAVLTKEFEEFVRDVVSGSGEDKLLLVNFQDRTSWREFARSSCLEALNVCAEFSGKLNVITLPKNTDFYFQTSHYQDIKRFSTFKEQLLEQFGSGGSGFHFSKKITSYLDVDHIQKNIDVIHSLVFKGKDNLSVQERLNFIEIFYVVLTLQLMLRENPKFMAFICKDGIDVSPCAEQTLYLAIKALTQKATSEEDLELVRSLCFSSAIMNRERGIDKKVFDRSIEALRVISEMSDDSRKKLLSDLGLQDLKEMKISQK
jgi:hypothetical protein